MESLSTDHRRGILFNPIKEAKKFVTRERKKKKETVEQTTSESKSTSGFVDNWQNGKSLAECNLQMLTSEDSCDVSFRVGQDEQVVQAHRYVLISRSCVFHAMLCGHLAESGEVTISDVDADVFSDFLRYLYTDSAELTPDNATSLLYLSKKYAVGGLEPLCLGFLEKVLSADNACVILEQAHMFDVKKLFDRALRVILQNGDTSLSNSGFADLCQQCLVKIIQNTDLLAEPEQVFSAALAWVEAECQRRTKETTPETMRSALGDTLYYIDFPAMDMKFFAEQVVPTRILSDSECTRIFCRMASPEVDISPFRSRSTTARGAIAHAQSYTKSYRTMVYDKHEKMSVIDKWKLKEGEVTQGFLMTCSHKIVLQGLLMFGSGVDHVDQFHVRIMESGTNDLLIDENFAPPPKTSPEFKGVVCIDFPFEVNLKRGAQHWVHVEKIEGASHPPLYKGVKWRSMVWIGGYTLNLGTDHGNTCDIIAGLVCKKPSPSAHGFG